MEQIVELHPHSKYARACSPQLTLSNIDRTCAEKGVTIMGTGDFTHPAWFASMQKTLEPAEPGLYRVRGSKTGTRFLCTSEIACIWSQGGKVRRLHIVVTASSLEAVGKINAALGKIGNLAADGRPILGLSAKKLAEIVWAVDETCLVIPAHAWTPWFSIFGSFSGFDSIVECFEELTPKIYAIETGLSCYDGKTEILTQDGWKKFIDVNYRDNICTLNLKNHEIEYQRAKKIYVYNYKGKMYRLQTKRADLLVTPNHRLLYSPCDFRTPHPFVLKEAELLFNKSKRFKKDGIWKGEEGGYFTLPAVTMKHGSRWYSGYREKKEKEFSIKPWLKFFGFWIAEGWTTKGKNGDYNVCLANLDKKLLLEMRRILEGFGYRVFQTDKIVRVRDNQLFHYLSQFGKCYDKFIPPEIKTLSKELLKIFLAYYIKGDGHFYGRNGKGMSATTTSVRLRDDLQEIALKTGISAYYRLHRKRGTPMKSPGYKYKKIYYQRNDSWVIYFIRKNIHTVLPSTIKKYNYIESWVNFDGPVYCVSVPNKVVYIRRNGIPLWCGNSDPPMNWRVSALDSVLLVSNSDAHSLPNIAREANRFFIPVDKLSYAEVQRIIREKDRAGFLGTIEFYPEEGMYHFDGHRACNVSLPPHESRRVDGKCPACGKPLTIGVLHRVEALADRPEDFRPPEAFPFVKMVELDKIIAEAHGIKSRQSKQVQKVFAEIVAAGGTELNILLKLDKNELIRIASPEVVEGILRVREGRVKIAPGFDGQYGTVTIFEPGEVQKRQSSLF